jgi:hypothetical protein
LIRAGALLTHTYTHTGHTHLLLHRTSTAAQRVSAAHLVRLLLVPVLAPDVQHLVLPLDQEVPQVLLLVSRTAAGHLLQQSAWRSRPCPFLQTNRDELCAVTIGRVFRHFCSCTLRLVAAAEEQ